MDWFCTKKFPESWHLRDCRRPLIDAEPADALALDCFLWFGPILCSRVFVNEQGMTELLSLEHCPVGAADSNLRPLRFVLCPSSKAPHPLCLTMALAPLWTIPSSQVDGWSFICLTYLEEEWAIIVTIYIFNCVGALKCGFERKWILASPSSYCCPQALHPHGFRALPLCSERENGLKWAHNILLLIMEAVLDPTSEHCVYWFLL